MMTKKAKPAPKKTSKPKKLAVTNTHSKTYTSPNAPAIKELSAESIFDKFIGATISTDRPQPKKLTDVFVEIEGDNGIETHLVDMRQCPQDIIDTFVGEL